jgi:ATP-dependent Clp protease ATP-binding subunit ClpB
VIIMTSNIGSQHILEHGQSSLETAERLVIQALRQHFKPEFLNRVDDTILFKPLTRAQLEHIVELQLVRLQQLLADRKITMEVTPEAKRVLAEEGYDPVFGARPLKRAIQRMIQNPLAMAVLEGRFGDGDHIVVGVGPDGGLSFVKAEEAVGVA